MRSPNWCTRRVATRVRAHAFMGFAFGALFVYNLYTATGFLYWLSMLAILFWLFSTGMIVVLGILLAWIEPYADAEDRRGDE